MKKRDAAIDLIKAFAIICVVTVHVCAGIYSEPVCSLQWLAGHLFGSLSRAGVPLFLMCSGVLFLDSDKDISLGKLFAKNILRIITAMLFWASAYKIYHLVLQDDLSLHSLQSAFKEVLLFRQEFHLYYLHIILIFYIFVPIIRAFSVQADKRIFGYTLAVWFALGIVYPTLCTFPPFSRITGIPLQWKLNMTYAAIGYCILGHYLKKYPLKMSVSVIFAAVGFAIVYFGTVIISLYRQSLYMGFLEGMTLGTCLLSAGIFGILNHAPIEIKAVIYLSKASFCIYLSHMFALYFLNELDFLPMPVLLIGTLLLSLGIYFILSHIPVLNKWII